VSSERVKSRGEENDMRRKGSGRWQRDYQKIGQYQDTIGRSSWVHIFPRALAINSRSKAGGGGGCGTEELAIMERAGGKMEISAGQSKS